VSARILRVSARIRGGCVLLVAVGCGTGGPPADRPHGPVAWVEAPRVAEGEAVRVHLPAGVQFSVPEPLRAERVSEGDDGTATWEVRGETGSYVLDVAIPGASSPVSMYVDIGVSGPTAGTLEDALPPVAATPSRWPWVLAASVGLGAVAAVAWRVFGTLRPPAPPPEPEPADVVARRAWALLRARTDLGPEVLAAGLSDVYRRYLDATHTWPATARTTREILDNLAGELPVAQLERARRLLGATDLVKFSEHGARASVLEALDDDFAALVVPRPRMSDEGVS
jgi:hypothetical protein